MLTAILTDLHANREAVTACLGSAEQRGAERYVFLGDLVGYGADPAWVVDTVRTYVECGALAVCGNHDEATVQEAREQMHPEARAAIAWTRSRLNSDQLGFLRNLPFTASDNECLYVHAEASQPREWSYVLGPQEAMLSILGTGSRITFCGHVHEPALYELAPNGEISASMPEAGNAIALHAHRRWLAVIGSVGQPRDANPAACYALYDDEASELTYVRVPYDHATTANKIRAAGLPDFFAYRLALGI
ncbi:MAG: metallophosphoesterase [Burkholderiaceae bacterium]|nr:metallophosphoesterase [Burkholderiaceae bacterium]